VSEILVVRLLEGVQPSQSEDTPDGAAKPPRKLRTESQMKMNYTFLDYALKNWYVHVRGIWAGRMNL
jgi:hypothetical protein